VTRNSANAGALTPISELSNYKIEAGDPDPRGSTVVGTAGSPLGTVLDLLVDTEAMKVRQLLVDVENQDGDGSVVTIDVNDMDLRTDRREVFARGHSDAAFDLSSAPRSASASTQASGADIGDERLTRTEEELRIGKREVARGEVRVGKHVETEHVSEPVTRRREEVVIERRPVGSDTPGDVAAIGEADVRREQGVHILRHTFCSHLGDEGGARAGHPGTRRPRGSADEAALHAPESRGNGRRDPVARRATGGRRAKSWRHFGHGVSGEVSG
jgi:hypothetical protein